MLFRKNGKKLSMKKFIAIGILAYLLISSCNTKTASLPDQLKVNFLLRVSKIDSTVHLDSFRIVRADSIDQRLERIIDDTIYVREFTYVQAQLANAIKDKKVDSVGFYQGEVDYMTPQVDSLTNVISKADTTRKLGIVAICSFQLSKNGATQQGMAYYFLDKSYKVWDSELIDTSIATVARKLN
jgi:hypothetical protein